MTAIWDWIEAEPSLSISIITGSGRKAFSSGADLKEWGIRADQALREGRAPLRPLERESGLKFLANRMHRKPVIAAVNGLAFGGGFELMVNCDLVIATDTATFSFPEGKRGLLPFAGALPRLIRIVGLQRASELALTGKVVDAALLMQWGLINQVVAPDRLLDEAIRWANMVVENNSPDSIVGTRAALRQSWITANVKEATAITEESVMRQVQLGQNMLEGLKAFKEKRKPVWGPSKL